MGQLAPTDIGGYHVKPTKPTQPPRNVTCTTRTSTSHSPAPARAHVLWLIYAGNNDLLRDFDRRKKDIASMQVTLEGLKTRHRTLRGQVFDMSAKSLASY